MNVLSVNVSTLRECSRDGRTRLTGIFKSPVPGRVRVGRLGLAGDAQAETKVHGGPWMAVYAYSEENYAWWRRELDRADLRPGHFGENLTVEGLPDDRVRTGDIFSIGTARLQVTQPRLPCHKLGMRMEDPQFPKRFLASGRLGFYLRVIGEGEIGAGDRIERTERGDEICTVARVARLRKFETHDMEGARRALGLGALSPTWKRAFERRLARAAAPSAGAPSPRR